MNRFLILTAAAAVMAGCSFPVKMLSGVEVTETYVIDTDFRTISASGAVSIIYSEDSDVMTVTADSVVMADFDYSLSDKILSLGRKRNVVSAYNGDPFIRVTLPTSDSLSEVSLSGASSFKSETVLEVPDFSISLSGASDFKGDVAVSNLDVKASGASDVDLTGYASSASYDISGASHVASADRFVKSGSVTLSVSGASSMHAGASVSVSGSVSGASSATCYGSPETSVGTSGASSFHVK